MSIRVALRRHHRLVVSRPSKTSEPPCVAPGFSDGEGMHLAKISQVYVVGKATERLRWMD